MRLIQLWEEGLVPLLDDPFIKDKVVVSLFQALTRTLLTQNSDGSWGRKSSETTAYAVISLTKLISLSFTPKIQTQTAHAIDHGRKFLRDNSHSNSKADHIWTGKVTSGFEALHEAYVLAALRAPMLEQQACSSIKNYFSIPLAKLTIRTKYYARQWYFADVSDWLIQAGLVESCLFLPQVRDIQYAIFPRESLADDTHFEAIPFVSLTSSNTDHRCVGAEYLYQMMVLSVLIRQLEQYVEKTMSRVFAGCLFKAQDIVHSIFQEIDALEKDRCFCDGSGHGTIGNSTATACEEVRSVLYRFTSHFINHPYVLMASWHDQSQLRSVLLRFLLCRISQLSGEQEIRPSVDETSHAFQFAFLASIVGNQSSPVGVGIRRNFLDTLEQEYLATELCRHLSIMDSILSRVPAQSHLSIPAAMMEPRSTPFTGESVRSTDTRSVSSASSSSSFYEDTSSPISPTSSRSSVSNNSPLFNNFPIPPKLYTPPAALHPATESSQMLRLLDYEESYLRLCSSNLVKAGINQRTANIVGFFIDAAKVSSHIMNDPNIGSTCTTAVQYKNVGQAGIAHLAPASPTRRKGSVAAARAAMLAHPTLNKRTERSQSCCSSYSGQSSYTAVTDQYNKSPRIYPAEREWSWNKATENPNRRISNSSSEVSRIESIMSEIDGFKIHDEVAHRTDTQPRTESGDAAPFTMSQINHDFTPGPGDHRLLNVEDVKLAKARSETQRRRNQEAQRRAAKQKEAEAKAKVTARRQVAERLQRKAMAEANYPHANRRATCATENHERMKAPRSFTINSAELMELHANSLYKTRRLTGPRWKAPF